MVPPPMMAVLWLCPAPYVPTTLPVVPTGSEMLGTCAIEASFRVRLYNLIIHQKHVSWPAKCLITSRSVYPGKQDRERTD